jgi:hypothetical protein
LFVQLKGNSNFQVQVFQTSIHTFHVETKAVEGYGGVYGQLSVAVIGRFLIIVLCIIVCAIYSSLSCDCIIGCILSSFCISVFSYACFRLSTNVCWVAVFFRLSHVQVYVTIELEFTKFNVFEFAINFVVHL